MTKPRSILPNSILLDRVNMLFCVFVCLLGSSVIWGYATPDRGSDMANKRIEDILDEGVLLPTSPPSQDEGEGDSPEQTRNIDVGEFDEIDFTDDYSANYIIDNFKENLKEEEEICQGFKDIVLEHLVGFPNKSEMSDKLDADYDFTPVIMKGILTFQLTNDEKMAGKQIMVGLTATLLDMTEHCPSTLFTRILFYAASKSVGRVLLQEEDAFDTILKLMEEHGILTPEQVLHHTKLMLGSIINDFTQDVITRQYNETHKYLKIMYPIVKSSLYNGEMAFSIDESLRNVSRETGITTRCMNAMELKALYQDVWSGLNNRFAINFDAVLKMMPLSELPEPIRDQVLEKSRVLLHRGVQIMKSILLGLRDERLGFLESEAQRLLSKAELKTLKKVVKDLHWHDDYEKHVHLPDENIMNKMVEKEKKDFEELNKLLKMVETISNNPDSMTNEPLLESLSLLSEKLNDLKRRKCDTYKKYFGAYGSPASEC